jgi:xanthine dehydrogenase YagS FAD-binding subunit
MLPTAWGGADVLDFDYSAPEQPKLAVAALGTSGSAVIAGGTELLNWMRLGIVAPSRLVDMRRLGGLDGISLEAHQLRIGARATLNEVGEHPLVREHAAVLGQACLKAASAQVRNRATLGGNILQKTRCAYFRAEAPLPWGCNKRQPGSGCAALDGLNERHAIFGWTENCVATQPSDPAVALACLDAEVETLGPDGPRTVAMTDFHVTPEEAEAGIADPAKRAEAVEVETRLASDEIITGYRIPVRQGERSAYVKVRERESFEYALVAAAATVSLDNGRIGVARLALGSVAMKPWRLRKAEAALAGMRLEREPVLAAIRDALADARPLQRNSYKVELAGNAALRALLAAGGQS